jgi:murein L,D-transpeptidase YcbB/YkuD
MSLTCDSFRAGAFALVALAWLGGPAAAQSTATALNTEPASAPPPGATVSPEASPAAAPATAATPAPAPAPAATPEDAAAPTVDPQMAAALTAALDALVAGDVKASPIGAGNWRDARLAIRAFYAARGFAPVWLDGHGLTPRGQAALRRLERADEDALDLSAFALPVDPPADATPERIAEAEATISAAAVAYAMQASGSRVIPTRISSLITARPTVADPGAALTAVAAAADPDAALEGYNPQQKGYRDLRDQLSRMRAAAPRPSPTPSAAPTTTGIPDGPSLGLGMRDPRVPLVRARLGVPADGSAAEVYDLPVAAAVQAFQRANGLPPNGALTSATAAALSGGAPTPAPLRAAAVSPARRLAMIVANMEMWRWEPRDMGAERIEINIPDYSLKLMEGDDLVHQARVIVGKPDTPTPVFSNEMKYILVNPIWRVPESIVRKELAPHLAEDPDYLVRRGYQVAEVGGHMFVSQPPGEGNALGHILFMFPNEHSVYLHDTPLRSLFGAARRAFSHGCVRVEQPMRLAELVMGAGWSSARLQSLIGATQRTVMLPHAIPIHLEYFTEFVDPTGALQEREDVYGIAARVAGTIAQTSQD